MYSQTSLFSRSILPRWDKSVARGLQSKFKDHTINILACSTTMEMGVDLGNLEVVMLSSVLHNRLTTSSVQDEADVTTRYVVSVLHFVVQT